MTKPKYWTPHVLCEPLCYSYAVISSRKVSVWTRRHLRTYLVWNPHSIAILNVKCQIKDNIICISCDVLNKSFSSYYRKIKTRQDWSNALRNKENGTKIEMANEHETLDCMDWHVQNMVWLLLLEYRWNVWI